MMFDSFGDARKTALFQIFRQASKSHFFSNLSSRCIICCIRETSRNKLKNILFQKLYLSSFKHTKGQIISKAIFDFLTSPENLGHNKLFSKLTDLQMLHCHRCCPEIDAILAQMLLQHRYCPSTLVVDFASIISGWSHCLGLDLNGLLTRRNF